MTAGTAGVRVAASSDGLAGSPTTALCTAVVDDITVGIPATDIRELVRGRAVTSVPLAGPTVRGLVNLRGDLVTAIDLRSRLARSPHPAPDRGVHVVLRDTPARSLLVDAVGEVVRPPPSALLDIPQSVADRVRPLLVAAALTTDGLVLVLDVTRVADLADCLADATRPNQEASR